jgi:hypothetical protein
MVVGSIATNDPRLCEGQGLELQILNKPQKMIRCRKSVKNTSKNEVL